MKMYILVNDDVKIGKGKLAGQVGHAVASFFYNEVLNGGYDREKLKEYMTEQKKILLKCPSEKLESLEKDGFITIRDKGYTQLEPNTLTCVMYGIFNDNESPMWLKELKLY